MKKSSPALLLAWGVALLLPCAVGCGGGNQAGATVSNAPLGEVYEDKPIDPNKVVDSQDSWRRFVALAKQSQRMKAAEKHFEGLGPANKVQIVFMKDGMEYVEFGANSPYKNVDPKRLYEVGVITLAAKENWGGDGFQIREYSLKFITPKRNGEWHFLMGTYHVTKFSGSLAANPGELRYVEDKEYERGYLRNLFIEPLAPTKAPTGPVATDGEAPVETKLQQ